MIYRDLREFITDLEKQGDILRLKDEINLEPDAGGIGWATLNMDGPAIIAENVVGYKTQLALCLHMSFQRMAMVFGLPKTATLKEQMDVWRKAHTRYPVKPKCVNKKDAPCKENIQLGKDVNIFQFPIPRINEQDGGPYLANTLCITKDPDSDWVNFGAYRMQVLDRNKTSLFTSHTTHLGEHYAKNRRRGKPLQMAVAIGTDPSLMVVSSTRIPRGWDEFAFAGALRGEPCEVTMGETVDLPIPAAAEIVLEGILHNDKDLFEGPFGEFTNAYGGTTFSPLFEITAITYRNNPIYDTCYIGLGRSPGHYLVRASKIAALELELKTTSQNITQIAYLLPGNENYVIQGNWANKMEPRRAILDLFASQGAVQAKMVTIVDEDIDPWDAEQVMWAISTRCQANTDMVMLPGQHCRLDPSFEMDGTSCLLGIDATKSKEPYPRHHVAEWVRARPEAAAWKERLTKLVQGGK